MQFDNLFQLITGHAPFPWQRRLYEQFIGDVTEEKNIPQRCSLPTGLGKTNVIAVWLAAWITHPNKLPRRLVYVVNRRTVVDQTTDEVEKIRRNLKNQDDLPETVRNLAISTLRGQYADNREWSADPSRLAVICGTVDMIGSRLLFSGYGVGYKGQPLHAGFLGQDVLLVHDEAHLEPAFQSLLESMEAEQRKYPSEKGRFRILELSATVRHKPDGQEEPKELPFTLSDEDRAHPEVNRRVQASKKLTLTPQSGKLGDQLAATAIESYGDSGRAILIFVRLVEDLKVVLDKLRKADLNVCQLSGTMRGWEREQLLKHPYFIRFLPEGNRPADVSPAEGTVFLVCTSAGEVGVNLSADHLICDLSTFESMAQRFGRVNRFGLYSDSEIHVIHPRPDDFENNAPDPQRKKTLELLEQLNREASPAALAKLVPAECEAAFAPLPEILPAGDILFDAWSLTSIREHMPGRPSVEPYLHGIRDWEPPETQVAWREEVGLIVDELREDYPPADLLDEYPLKPHELLRDRTDRVWKELAKLAEHHPQAPVWIVDDQGTLDPSQLESLAQLDRKQAENQLGGKIVILPHNVGGLTKEGLLDGSYFPDSFTEETPGRNQNDVADMLEDPEKGPLRIRVWEEDNVEDEKEEDLVLRFAQMRHILCIEVPASEEGEDSVKRTWHWFELPIPKDNSKNATNPVLLDSHVTDVEDKVKDIVSRLTFDEDETTDCQIKHAIVLAARFHDLGKRREVWQRSIGRPEKLANIWFGKSGKLGRALWKPRRITEYRHEFGSLVDLQSHSEFQSLDEDFQDLVLHLIAAHHGQARPHFTAPQVIDPNSETSICEAIAQEVPRRFARLQRKLGRWRLAYLESILRAADWHASAEPNPSGFYTEDAT